MKEETRNSGKRRSRDEGDGVLAVRDGGEGQRKIEHVTTTNVNTNVAGISFYRQRSRPLCYAKRLYPLLHSYFH